MIRDDDSGRASEPEDGNLREHLALVGDARSQDVVERRNPIGRHDQQAVVEIVNIADLAVAIGPASGERGFENGRGERQQNSLAEKKMHLTKERARVDNNNI